MNKIFVCAILIALSIKMSNLAFAGTTASQTITATLSPFMSITNVNEATTGVTINNDGSLSSNLTPSFKFSSNNKNGAIATFNIKINTSDGNQVDAMSGVAESTSGRIILANINVLPTAISAKNALSDNPVTDNNPDVIAYTVTFKSKNTSNGSTPAFDKAGDSVSGHILNKSGINTITAIIDKSSGRDGTFSSADEAGNYQAIIYCTSAAL